MRPKRKQVLRHVPELVENHEEYEVETILNKCKLQSRDTEYLVKWRGYHVKGSNMGTKFGIGECQEGGARL